MGIELIFKWHQLMHFIVPILGILILQKRLGLRNLSVIILMLGVLKEIRDLIFYHDPLWLSGIDLIFNLSGIAIGILICKLLNRTNK